MTSPTPVVFIHGLWIHADAWQPWVDLFRTAGYDPVAPPWPGDSADVAQTRANTAPLVGNGAAEITRHYSRIIKQLPSQPIVVGHSFGGLVAQKLLAQGDAQAAVAIDPGQIKGVKALPLTQLRSGFSVLKNPGNRRRAVGLTAEQFRYNFGNTLTREESDELHERWAIPGPGQVPFEIGLSNFTRHSPVAVDTRTSDRGPLLFIAGGRDHAAPQSVVNGAYKRYAASPAIADLHVFPDRGHSLVFDHGWREVADYVLDWLARTMPAA